MNSIQVTSKPILSSVVCPTSKSYANRAIILAALDSRECTISGLPQSQDVIDLIANLKQVGLKIEESADSVIIKNSFPQCEQINSGIIQLEGSEGGTTIRFLLSLLSLGSNCYSLKLKGRMPQRPLDNQILTLGALGAKITQLNNMVTVQGPIKPDREVKVDCSETTQFCSSLLLLTKTFPITVTPTNLEFSKGYLEMTKELITSFYSNYTVPVDYSGLSYLAAYASLNQHLLISNAKTVDWQQGDARLLNWISKYTIDEKGLKVYKQTPLEGVNWDISNSLDLFPTLCYLAMFSTTNSTFSGLAPLRHKESDRLTEMIKIFDYLGQPYKLKYNELEIRPAPLKLPTKPYQLPPDHRIVMCFALITKQLGGGSVSEFQAVKKSFPEFFDIF